MERLDEELRATIHNTMGESKVKDGMDIGLCLIDHSQHYMHFAGAKRPLYLFRPDGTFIEIKGTRRSIGGDNLADQMPFENHEIRLEEGMSFYLFSDGIVDQFGWEREPGKPPPYEVHAAPFQRTLRKNPYLTRSRAKRAHRNGNHGLARRYRANR